MAKPKATKKRNGNDEAIKNCHLVHIGLVESHFFMRSEFDELMEGSQKFLELSCSDDVYFDEEQKTLQGVVNCVMWMVSNEIERSTEEVTIGNSQDTSSEDVIILIQGAYHVAYAVDGGVTENEADQFFRSFSSMAAYPYFRQHVADVAARASVSIPILPIKRLRYPLRGYESSHNQPELFSSEEE